MKNLMTSIRSRREQGNALVLVISFIFIIGMIIALLVAIVIDANGKATSTRANAQAVAAAEGGVDLYLQHLLTMEGACYAPGTGTYDNDSAAVEYKVLATQYKTATGTNWIDCTPGEPLTGKNVHTLMVKVSGRADDQSRSRESANEATVERVLQGSVSTPFNEAVFGDQGITTSTDLQLKPDDQLPPGVTPPSPDLVTKGKWYCPSKSTIDGSIFALGGGTTNSTCIVHGDLYVNGDFNVPASLTVGGNLYVNGNLTTNSGSLHVGSPTKPGNVLVRGNYYMNQADTIYGDIRATGTFGTTDKTALSKLSGNLYLGRGKLDDSFNLNEAFKTYASKIFTNQDTSGPKWTLPSIMEEATRTPEEVAKLQYPFIFKDNPIFDGFTVKTFTDFKNESGMQGKKDCTGYDFTKKIVVTTPTIFDMSECDLVKSAGTLNIELKADAAFYVKSFTNSSGTINILNGEDASSTKRHSFYLIAKPKDGQNTCVGYTDSKVASKITLPSGTLNQKDATGRSRTKVLLYSAGITEVNSINMDTFYGQVYGCTVYVPTTQNFRFARVGDDDSTQLSSLSTKWTRDITN